VKPTATCVPLTDGSAVVVHRPIAADNSCLFNAVGYCMHHSTNRAPFLRQVVSREVSSDPQVHTGPQPGLGFRDHTGPQPAAGLTSLIVDLDLASSSVQCRRAI